MKFKTSNRSTKVIHVNEDKYDCRMSTAKEFDEYQKAVEKTPVEVTKLMISFLERLGMPEEVLWEMEFGQLQSLVSFLTIGEVAKGK